MKKNTLQAFNAYEDEFKNTLECSSIRLNAEDENELMEIRNTNTHPKEIKILAKRYEENSLAGFEQSLSMSGNQDNILQLMRSKSAGLLKKSKDQKPNPHVKQKTGLQNMHSLYNTSSFDEMTMKMSINKTNQNMSQLHNLTNLTDQERKLKKPQEMQKYKVTYADNEMKIMINQINRMPPSKIQEDIVQTEQERLQRQKKVRNFMKNQALLQSLKCSNVESEHSQNLQNMEDSSFQQPYFKAAVNNNSRVLIEDLQLKESIKLSEKPKQKEWRKPDLKVIVPPHPKSPPPQRQIVKSPGKKITLRDYIHLNQLSSKTIQKDASTPGFLVTPGQSRSERRTSMSRKKKGLPSNSQVFSKIKSEIGSDLKLMESNIRILAQYFSSQSEQAQPEHEQIMRLHTISRMIKEKMLMGNDEIVKYMQQKK